MDENKLKEFFNIRNNHRILNPPKAEIQNLQNLYNDNKLDAVLAETQKYIYDYPSSLPIWNLMGATAAQMGELNCAKWAFENALQLKPDSAQIHNNLGNVQLDCEDIQGAVDSFKKALSIEPNYAEAYNNLGNAFVHQANMQTALFLYAKALILNPNYITAAYNYIDLKAQLSGSIVLEKDIESNLDRLVEKFDKQPTFQIVKAVEALIKNKIDLSSKYLENFHGSDNKLKYMLSAKEKAFCFGYSSFLDKIIRSSNKDVFQKPDDNIVYHLGESHCLSYAHQKFSLSGQSYKIVPKITFGAKAYHFASGKKNKFKSITQTHLNEIPSYSRVLVSFGEIDCRSTDGIIPASIKLQLPREKIVSQTVKEYLDWLNENNLVKKHDLFILNIPCPVYNYDISKKLNSQVAETVRLFNAALNRHMNAYKFNLIDVYGFSAGGDDFSNGRYHVDGYHLGREALPKITKQLSDIISKN